MDTNAPMPLLVSTTKKKLVLKRDAEGKVVRKKKPEEMPKKKYTRISDKAKAFQKQLEPKDYFEVFDAYRVATDLMTQKSRSIVWKTNTTEEEMAVINCIHEYLEGIINPKYELDYKTMMLITPYAEMVFDDYLHDDEEEKIVNGQRERKQYFAKQWKISDVFPNYLLQEKTTYTTYHDIDEDDDEAEDYYPETVLTVVRV